MRRQDQLGVLCVDVNEILQAHGRMRVERRENMVVYKSSYLIQPSFPSSGAKTPVKTPVKTQASSPNPSLHSSLPRQGSNSRPTSHRRRSRRKRKSQSPPSIKRKTTEPHINPGGACAEEPRTTTTATDNDTSCSAWRHSRPLSASDGRPLPVSSVSPLCEVNFGPFSSLVPCDAGAPASTSPRVGQSPTPSTPHPLSDSAAQVLEAVMGALQRRASARARGLDPKGNAPTGTTSTEAPCAGPSRGRGEVPFFESKGPRGIALKSPVPNPWSPPRLQCREEIVSPRKPTPLRDVKKNEKRDKQHRHHHGKGGERNAARPYMAHDGGRVFLLGAVPKVPSPRKRMLPRELHEQKMAAALPLLYRNIARLPSTQRPKRF